MDEDMIGKHICINCKHLRDINAHPDKSVWYNYQCAASQYEEMDWVLGVAIKHTMKYCKNVNTKGFCFAYERRE